MEETRDIGEIIAKVQDDLQYLHAAATRGFMDPREGDTSVDLETLKMVLARTEEGMQTVAEKVLHSTHDNITTLPAVARKTTIKQEHVGSATRTKSTRHRRSHSAPEELSAGQFCLVEHMSQLVAHPANPLTHRMLTNYYDLSTGDLDTPIVKSGPGQLLVGTTVDQLTTLSKSNRRDPLLTPPPISQTDACKGLLSLLERGLIPPAAEIVLSPPPVQPQSLRLHTPSKQHGRPQRIADGVVTQLAGVKLDSTPINKPASIQIPTASKSHSPTPSQEFPAMTSKHLILELPDAVPDVVQHSHVRPEKRASTSYKVVIQNGNLVDGTNDFILFEKEQQSQWQLILRALEAMVDLCKNFSIPLCIIDGNSLVHLAQECELGLKPTKQALLAIMINKKDVHDRLMLAGQRYRGPDGKHAAATKIRATYLMFKERNKYLDRRRRKWAAGILSMAWLMFLKMHGIRQKLKLIHESHLEAHRSRMTELRKRWSIIQCSKRTIIHMTSQGFSQHVRASMPHFQIEQSLQIGRFCDIQDPNVEVVYVSPTPLTQEMTDYYYRLADMGTTAKNSKKRLHFVHPENFNRFKSHNLSLASLILYSPTCMSRIKRLIAGREAYMVSGMISKEDLALAYKLGVALFGSEPEVSHLYSTKAGARRLLSDANITIPPYKADIVSQEQLLQALAGLIANNLLIQRWIFKMPEQVRGRGFAYCDVIQHLPCYEWVVKEANRYGAKWTKCWAQENALKKICSYLPAILSDHARVVDTTLYPHWTHFLKHFLQVGGLIEGAPPSDSVTPLAVDLVIEPTGQVKVLCTLDQICSTKYVACGGSVPQTSIPHSQLMDAVHNVAEACKTRGILGHFSIDFLTFIDPASMCQTLWCVDLDLGYSNNLALYKLMNYLTGYGLDVNSGALISSDKTEVETPHYAVLTPHLYHSNLSLYYHSIFFQMCKAHLIGFNPHSKSGTVFNLADDKHKEYLGMICIRASLLGAVQTCSSNLSVIHQEISTTSMQGSSNFMGVIGELDKIIDLINSNAET